MDGLCQWKIPVKPAGIKSAIFWLVALCQPHMNETIITSAAAEILFCMLYFLDQ